jgi:hypothetical protein
MFSGRFYKEHSLSRPSREIVLRYNLSLVAPL